MLIELSSANGSANTGVVGLDAGDCDDDDDDDDDDDGGVDDDDDDDCDDDFWCDGMQCDGMKMTMGSHGGLSTVSRNNNNKDSLKGNDSVNGWDMD